MTNVSSALTLSDFCELQFLNLVGIFIRILSKRLREKTNIGANVVIQWFEFCQGYIFHSIPVTSVELTM